MRWVKVSDQRPKIDSIVRRIGYTDVMDSGDFLPLLKNRQNIDSEHEWLDESESPSEQDAAKEVARLKELIEKMWNRDIATGYDHLFDDETKKYYWEKFKKVWF